MQNVVIRFYVSEKKRHQGQLTYEWLLAEGRRLGVPGGSAFRALAGFGRHGHLHEETFFELAGELPVLVEFVMDSGLAEKMLETVRAQRLNLFYLRYLAETGVA